MRQDVLGVLVRELSNFQHNGRTGAFRCWSRNIVFNRLRVCWRTRRKAACEQLDDHALQSLEDPLGRLETYWDQEHDRWVLQELLKLVQPAFTETTWQAFRRQLFDGARATEVAAELGISVNSALLAKSRVLRRAARRSSEGFIDDV